MQTLRTLNRLLKSLAPGTLVALWWSDANNDPRWMSDTETSEQLKSNSIGAKCFSVGVYVGQTKTAILLAMDRDYIGQSWNGQGSIPKALITNLEILGSISPKTGDYAGRII